MCINKNSHKANKKLYKLKYFHLKNRQFNSLSKLRFVKHIWQGYKTNIGVIETSFTMKAFMQPCSRLFIPHYFRCEQITFPLPPSNSVPH